jgi:putative transposase
MSNHFHLLATPETAEGIPQMMQAVGAATCATTTCARPHRHAVGRALPVDADPGRALPAGLHGLHGPQSGARRMVADRRTTRGRATALHRPARRQAVTPHPLWEWATRLRPRPGYAELVPPALAQQQAALTTPPARLGARRADYVPTAARTTPGRPGASGAVPMKTYLSQLSRSERGEQNWNLTPIILLGSGVHCNSSVSPEFPECAP